MLTNDAWEVDCCPWLICTLSLLLSKVIGFRCISKYLWYAITKIFIVTFEACWIGALFIKRDNHCPSIQPETRYRISRKAEKQFLVDNSLEVERLQCWRYHIISQPASGGGGESESWNIDSRLLAALVCGPAAPRQRSSFLPDTNSSSQLSASRTGEGGRWQKM